MYQVLSAQLYYLAGLQKGMGSQIEWKILRMMMFAKSTWVNYCEQTTLSPFDPVEGERLLEAFMDCRIENKDPRKCLKEGREVTQCAMSFFKKVKATCNEEFTNYWTCLDYNNQDFTKCRKSQAAFDGCMLEKLKIERPKPKEYN